MNRAEKIIEYHNKAIGAARDFIRYAILAGEELFTQKYELDHGEWLPWIKENLPFSHDTANRYLKAYKNRYKLRGAAEFESLTEFLGEESRDERRESKSKSKLTQEEQAQQYWDKHQREELERDTNKRQKADGVVHEFPAYQTEWDQFWNRIMDQYPREKQIEIAQELIENLWKRYPEIGGSPFRVVERDN